MATVYIFDLSNDKGKELTLELTKPGGLVPVQDRWKLVPEVNECFSVTSGFVKEEKINDDKEPGKLICGYGGRDVVVLNGAQWDSEPPDATGGADVDVIKECMGRWSWKLSEKQ